MGWLDDVVERVGQIVGDGQLPVVIFDLDSTLIDTAPRQHRILVEFAAHTGDRDLQDLVARIAVDELGYRVEAPLERRGITDRALLRQLRAFWGSRFFTNAYCALDRPAAGAVPFVRRVFEAGALVYYLTGRPADMVEGTLSVLRGAGFPVLRGRGLLHMKPTHTLSDRRFKERATADVHALCGQVAATFENEPAHAATYLRAFPGAQHFLVGDVRSPDAPPPDPALVCIESFHA